MGDLRFMPFKRGEVTGERQLANLFTKLQELQKRVTDGSVSPELTIDGLQYLIEGKYLKNDSSSLLTKIGPFKKFGRAIPVHDKDFSFGYGSKGFFKDTYAEHAERGAPSEELISLFDLNMSDAANWPYVEPTKLAPYRFPKMKIGELFLEIGKHDLLPKLVLGHIDILLSRYCGYNALGSYCELYQGEDGNYFPIMDVHGNFWFLWLWLHGDGAWAYRFYSVEEYADNHFEQKFARLWLLPESGYKEPEEK